MCNFAIKNSLTHFFQSVSYAFMIITTAFFLLLHQSIPRCESGRLVCGKFILAFRLERETMVTMEIVEETETDKKCARIPVKLCILVQDKIEYY